MMNMHARKLPVYLLAVAAAARERGGTPVRHRNAFPQYMLAPKLSTCAAGAS